MFVVEGDCFFVAFKTVLAEPWEGADELISVEAVWFVFAAEIGSPLHWMLSLLVVLLISTRADFASDLLELSSDIGTNGTNAEGVQPSFFCLECETDG